MTFARPYAEVYRAAATAVERAQATPEWKELEVRVDDPSAGVLIAERRLEGVIPGVRVRDLWSFYLARVSDHETQVTFVLESSDHPKPTVSARSWAKGQDLIFPAMREILGTEGRRTVAADTPPPTASAAPVGAAPAPAAPSSVPMARATAAPPAPRGAPAPDRNVLDRALAALRASEDWQAATRERTVDGERLVMIGAWAQLSARGGRCGIAFPTYPAPPAYEVARLMRFLTDQDVPVDVLPGSAFRAP